ncbi:MAG: ATP-binding protein [Planctomycetaceae bacterium]|nr:ATP-binding protein [Planctomycetaceae bacterium]
MLSRYAEIAELAGGLAHEIRNPLSTISMNLDLLVEDLASSDAPRDRRTLDKLHTVQSECRHLEEILDAFLQFARVGELDLVPTDLNSVVSRFLDFYRPQADDTKIEISPHLQPGLPAVAADEPLLRQMLMNLCRNAADAMPGGGRLEIQTTVVDNRVALVVIDNGRGMDDAARSRMFDTFFSTRPSGSGLGLPTVRKIVQAHLGTIDCESEPGQGTKFTILLPIETETSS